MKNIRNIRHEETSGICGDLPAAAPLTQSEAERIKARTLNLISPRRRKPRRFAVAAAAIVCMFALIACSAEVFHWNYRFSALLNLDNEQKIYAEKNLLAQNLENPISAECSGLKITLRQTVTDGNLCYLIFDAELPENWAYLAEGAPIFGNTLCHGLTEIATGSLSFPQDMSTDSNLVSLYAVGYMEEESAEEDLPFTIVFEDFYYRTISSTETVKGLWSISGTISRKDVSLRNTVDIPYSIASESGAAETGRIVSYSLTPLTLTLKNVPDRTDPENSLFYNNCEIAIRYRNGSEISVNSVNAQFDRMGGYLDRENNEQVNYHTVCLDQLINVEEVSEIVYNGITIPVKE